MPYDSIINMLSVVSDLSVIVNYLKIGMEFGEGGQSLDGRLTRLEAKFEKYKTFLDALKTKVMESHDKTGLFEN